MYERYNIKFLPRTGIEQPYSIHTPKFIDTTKEYEPVAQMNPQLISQLEAEEQESGGAQSNINSKIVYDCMDPSPFYDSSREQTYINENEFVDLGPIEEEKGADANQAGSQNSQMHPGKPGQKGSSQSLNQQAQ